MNKEKIKTLINKCIDHYEVIYKQSKKLDDCIGYEGVQFIFNNVYFMIDSYIDVVSELIGDNNNWLAYYIFDCNCGKQPKNVYLNEVDETVLDSVDKLIYLIENY